MRARTSAEWLEKLERRQKARPPQTGPLQRIGPAAVRLRQGEAIPLAVLRQAFCLAAAAQK